jgi:Flp pilus assembly pilin Flp
MIGLIKKLVKDESGQDLAEYGIALLVIAGGAAVAAIAIAANVTVLWNKAETAIAAAA